MVDAYRSHRPQIAFHPDAKRALHRLRGHFRLGLITDGAREQQWAKINALGVKEMVEEIIVTSELTAPGQTPPKGPIPPDGKSHPATPPFGKPHPAIPPYGKPHPMAFELTAHRFGVEHVECVYVADNPAKDFVAPNALGWLSVQVRRSDGIYLDAITADGGGPDHLIDSLDELDKLLQRTP
jgi:putative hydrolase of the HAD superfamily